MRVSLLCIRYSLYTSEKKMLVEQECGTKSMSVLSKQLGKMWSALTTDQKSVLETNYVYEML